MKKTSLLLLLSIFLFSCKQASNPVPEKEKKLSTQIIDTSDMTNNFYDNVATLPLQPVDLYVEGEIANPGKVDFTDLPMHSVIVKETLLDKSGGDRFVGAYRYDGYSLFDILNKRILKKANIDQFRPIIDLYVEIENAAGEKVIFSWGEIYYPTNLHKILIVNGVARIVPSKTKELWPLPQQSKIVAAGDLVTERNIPSPVKITIKSYRRSFTMNQGMSPMYSPSIDIFTTDKKTGQIDILPVKLNNVIFNTIFYGRGKGIHSTTPFGGIMLKDLLIKYYPVTKENLMTGIICIAGKDGYRSVVSFSELFNRNDQQEFMLIKTNEKEDGGLFRIFAASDFFSDRAIKAVSEIHFSN